MSVETKTVLLTKEAEVKITTEAANGSFLVAVVRGSLKGQHTMVEVRHHFDEETHEIFFFVSAEGIFQMWNGGMKDTLAVWRPDLLMEDGEFVESINHWELNETGGCTGFLKSLDGALALAAEIVTNFLVTQANTK